MEAVKERVPFSFSILETKFIEVQSYPPFNVLGSLDTILEVKSCDMGDLIGTLKSCITHQNYSNSS